LRWLWAALAVVALLVAATLARSLWLPLIARYLVVADPLAPADALAPLGGGRGRVIYAAHLYEEGLADWFVAPNMPLNVPGIDDSYGELVRREAVARGVPFDAVVLMDGVVETTYQEALAVRAIAEGRNWDSLLLVTDPFHTRRARLAFRRAFRGSDVSFGVRPVNAHWYDPERWWQSRDGLRETWTEYLKLILFMVGYG
jgi:uncharacterized SAM-binding protein YcdF (DUF218 family)